jgi:hypothetical protein
MKTLSSDELKSLIATQEGYCISVYMPIYRSGAESQNQIRLRNLLRTAEDKLLTGGCRPQEAKTILEPAHGLIGNVTFWRQQGDGLAIFISPDLFRYYRLPVGFDELVVLSDRFYIKPLMQMVASDDCFYILTLSQNEIHLFESTRQHMREVEISTIPKSLAEALQYDEPIKQARFHRFHRGSPGGNSMIAGHSPDMEDSKENILKYFRQIDKGLREFLKDEQSPLILAGVDYLFPIYKEANTYARLMGEGIAGNPKGMSVEQLHRQAWDIAGAYFQRDENDAIAQYRQSSGTGLTSKDIIEIVPASYHGRVGVLFINKDCRQWGFFDSTTDNVRLNAKMEGDSEDLIDFAAIQTFLHSGTVFVLQPIKMPDDTPLAAVFRY